MWSNVSIKSVFAVRIFKKGLTMNVLILAGIALLGLGIFQETKGKQSTTTTTTTSTEPKKKVDPLENVNGKVE